MEPCPLHKLPSAPCASDHVVHCAGISNSGIQALTHALGGGSMYLVLVRVAGVLSVVISLESAPRSFAWGTFRLDPCAHQCAQGGIHSVTCTSQHACRWMQCLVSSPCSPVSCELRGAVLYPREVHHWPDLHVHHCVLFLVWVTPIPNQAFAQPRFCPVLACVVA